MTEMTGIVTEVGLYEGAPSVPWRSSKLNCEVAKERNRNCCTSSKSEKEQLSDKEKL